MAAYLRLHLFYRPLCRSDCSLSPSSSTDSDGDSYMSESTMDEAFPVDEAIAPLLSELPPTHPNPVVTPNRHAASEPTKGNTPRKANMRWTSKSGKWVDDRVLQHIRNEFGNNCSYECPLLKFFEQVLKVKPSDIPTGKLYFIKRDMIKGYCNAPKRGTSRSRHEKRTYSWFIKIIESLIEQTGLPRGLFSLKALGDIVLQGDYTKNKPDVGNDQFPKATSPSWHWQAFVFEVKNDILKRLRHAWPDRDLNIVLEFSQENAQTPGDGGNQDGGERYDVLYEEEDEEEPRAAAQASKGKDKASATTGKKRAAPADKGVGSDKKRARTASGHVVPQAVPDLDSDALQTSKYLNNLLSHNIRSHGISILLSHTRVTMFYCDRVGVIISETFDFLDQPQYLLLLAIAIATASLQTLGVSSLVQFPNSKFTTYKGASLTLTDPIGTDENGDEEVIKGTVEFDLDVTDNRKIITNLGAIGRCTTVAPLKVRRRWVGRFGSSDVVGKIGWPLAEWKPEDATIRSLRRRMSKNNEAASHLQHIPELKCSFKRSMKDMGVPRAFMEEYVVPALTRECRVLIMPVYLPLWKVNSIDEFKNVFTGAVRGHRWAWEVGNILHRDVSATNIMFYRRGNAVVGVLNDWDLAVDRSDLRTKQFDLAAEIKLLKKKFPLKVDNQGESTLSSGAQSRSNKKRDQVSDAQQPRSSGARAESPSVRAQEMKAARQRSSQGGSSSRTKPPPPPTRQHDPPHITQPARAPLSEKAAGPDAAQSTGLPHKTGTGPFMALEVLRTSVTPYHRYRFDLESFLYVLIWFCVSFDPQTQTEPPGIDAWQLRDFKDLEEKKVQFLRDPQIRADLFASAISPQYGKLLHDWAYRLCLTFDKIRQKSDQLLNEVGEYMLIPRKKKTTLKDSKEKIKRIAAERELIITYKGFMEVLEDEENQEGGEDEETGQTDEENAEDTE